MTRKKLTESKMPAVPELERAILGVILLDNSTYHQAAELLQRSDFYVERHRQIYGAMQALSDRAEAMDELAQPKAKAIPMTTSAAAVAK